MCKRITERTDGRIVENWCINIGKPCWEYWEEHQDSPIECESYCKAGEYEPTGIWKEFVDGVMKPLAKLIEETEGNT